MLLDDGQVTTFLHTRSITVGPHGPNEQTRCHCRVPRTRERPQDPSQPACFQVVGRSGNQPASSALVEPRTIQRELPSRSCSRLNLQDLRTRVRRNSSELCQETNHCLKHSILACTAGSALWGKPTAMVDVTHLPALGHTASAACNLIPCMVAGAIPMPTARNLEHGQMLVPWRLEYLPSYYISQPCKGVFS